MFVIDEFFDLSVISRDIITLFIRGINDIKIISNKLLKEIKRIIKFND